MSAATRAFAALPAALLIAALALSACGRKGEPATPAQVAPATSAASEAEAEDD